FPRTTMESRLMDRTAARLVQLALMLALAGGFFMLISTVAPSNAQTPAPSPTPARTGNHAYPPASIAAGMLTAPNVHASAAGQNGFLATDYVTGFGQFGGPSGVAFDSSSNLFVL